MTTRAGPRAAWAAAAFAVFGLAFAACGPGERDEQTTSSTAEASTRGEASSTTANDGSSSVTSASSGTTTAGSTGGCVDTFAVGPFELATELSLGHMSIADVDLDGTPDVVGGRGVVLFSDLSVVALPDPPATNNARVGELTGDDAPDMVFASGGPNEALVVYPSLAVGGQPPVVTAGESALKFAVGDYDRDGIGDVASALEDGTEIWHGEGDGTFTSLGLVGPDYPSALTFFTEGNEPRLLVAAGIDPTVRIYRPETGAFVEHETFVQPSMVSVEEVDFIAGETGHVLMTVWWGLPFGEVSSNVSVISGNAGRWGGWVHDLEGRFAYDAAMADVDGDGVGEIAVIDEDEDGAAIIALVCRAGAELVRCGTTGVPAVPFSVELLAEGPRLLFTTLEEGTWIADLAISPCD